MNIFNVFKRKREQEIRADTTETSLLTFFGISGELTREATMEIPTVSACVNKISETISRLPVKLYKRNADEVTEITSDNRLKLLNGETGDTLNTVEMWKACISDYYLGRGAWIYVHSDGIETKSLHYVSDNNISFLQNNDPIFKAYKVLVQGKQYYNFQFIKLLRKTADGYTNIPVQSENPTIFSAAYNALKLENAIASNGGCKSGFLKAKNRLAKEAIAEIKSGYSKIYDNSGEKDKIIVLNDGIEFQEISSTSVEMQMNEIKKTNSIEICKIFGFPHTVLDGGASSEDIKAFVSCVISLLNQIETALDMSLLLESEKNQGFYFAFDTKELTRGSQLERYQAYAIALKNRFLQIDEIRKEEDYDPMGFNFITLGLGDVLLNPETKQVYTPNTNQITYLNEELRGRGNPNHDEKGRFCSGNGGGGGSAKTVVDKSGESGIIESEECIIAPEKISGFFLKPGAKHSKEFFDVGYTEKDYDKLRNDLINSFDYSKAVDKSKSSNGVERFSIFAQLGVIKKKRFRTVWQKDTPESKPRIITAHREG